MPIEVSENSTKPHKVRGYNFSKTRPTPIQEPYIASYSRDCMKMIGIDTDTINVDENNAALAEYLCGNKLCLGSDPVSHCYCGYQFGHFSGQLGDGRAISLGDVVQVGESEFGPEGTLLDL